MPQGWIAELLYALIALATIAGFGAFAVFRLGLGVVRRLGASAKARLTARKAAPAVERREVPRLPSRAAAEVASDEDLFACPRRLAELESQLADRHQAVRQQADLLRSRQTDLETKGQRDELTRKYNQDRLLLDRRAASMRRVLGLVWKTRSALLLRAHLAQTARSRPELGPLPDVPPTGKGPEALRAGTTAWHTAAAAVRTYLDLVERRESDLAALLPAVPHDAEVDDALRAQVSAEEAEVRASYRALRDDMDRLADNLTWLGDHFATLAVVESAPAGLGPEGGPGELVREVEDALVQLADLARAVDPAIADAAVESLAEDITHLEAAGLEAQAEADAEIEVARLLRAAAG